MHVYLYIMSAAQQITRQVKKDEEHQVAIHASVG